MYPVVTQCRVLEVSTSGYYAWLKRLPSPRSVSNGDLLERIKGWHERSDGTYGAPRIHQDLVEDGHGASLNRVARVMRAAGIQGVSGRKPTKTTVRDKDARPAPDLVDRDFSASGPNKLWVADITYVPTGAGVLYLAVVVDAWSRRVIGWAMAAHMRTELVLDALEMAVQQRRAAGAIHHSDQGSQYTSLAFGARCEKLGVRPSMGSVGDCFDNAMCESFFGTLEREVIDRRTFRTRGDARLQLFEYIEGWYNPHRRHSALGYLSPIAYERKQASAVPGAADLARDVGSCGAVALDTSGEQRV
jgi:putative transposase